MLTSPRSHESDDSAVENEPSGQTQAPQNERTSYSTSTGNANRKSGRRSKRRAKSRTLQGENSVRIVQRLREPIVVCFRCGERFYTTWSKEFNCPKCGRRPSKIQWWEGALYLLLPPAALVGIFNHRKDSPRRSLIVFLLGLAGSILYFFLLRR